MTTPNLMLYGLLLIPFLGTLLAGYARFRVGPFFGLIMAAGATSVLLSYLLLDFRAAAIQFGALGLGALLFLLGIGLFGERFSYRSPMLLLSAISLFPLGLIIELNNMTALITYGSLLALNFLFALLLAYIRRNALTGRKGREKPKDRYFLTIPTIVSTVVAGLMVLAQIGS